MNQRSNRRSSLPLLLLFGASAFVAACGDPSASKSGARPGEPAAQGLDASPASAAPAAAEQPAFPARASAPDASPVPDGAAAPEGDRATGTKRTRAEGSAAAVPAPRGAAVPLRGSRRSGSRAAKDLPDVATPASEAPAAGADEHADGPRLELLPGEAGKVEFGKVIEGDKLTHTFHLRTAGTEPLVVDHVKTPCKCTRARVFALLPEGRTKIEGGEEIPPGTQVEIEVDISSHERVGRWNSHVIVASNDPTSPLHLMLTAQVEGILDFEPGEVMGLGQLSLGGLGTGHMRISSKYLDPFLLTFDPKESGKVWVDLVPEDPTPDGKAKAWDVSVQVGPLEEKGWQTWPVHLVTDKPVPWPKIRPRDGSTKMFEVLFYVHAEVADAFQFDPHLLSFGKVEGDAPVERAATLRRTDGAALPASPATKVRLTTGEDLAPALSCEVHAVDGENALRVVLRLGNVPEGFEGPFQGAVDVVFGDGPDDVASLRFAGSCR